MPRILHYSVLFLQRKSIDFHLALSIFFQSQSQSIVSTTTTTMEWAFQRNLRRIVGHRYPFYPSLQINIRQQI